MAFGMRIGQRLRDTVAATVTAADAETSVALVPILAERDAAAKRAASAAFPGAGLASPAATDGEGWYAGTLFGDLADLGIESIESERASPGSSGCRVGLTARSRSTAEPVDGASYPAPIFLRTWPRSR